jgi:hypothetical protein
MLKYEGDRGGSTLKKTTAKLFQVYFCYSQRLQNWMIGFREFSKFNVHKKKISEDPLKKKR